MNLQHKIDDDKHTVKYHIDKPIRINNGLIFPIMQYLHINHGEHANITTRIGCIFYDADRSKSIKWDDTAATIAIPLNIMSEIVKFAQNLD